MSRSMVCMSAACIGGYRSLARSSESVSDRPIMVRALLVLARDMCLATRTSSPQYWGFCRYRSEPSAMRASGQTAPNARR